MRPRQKNWGDLINETIHKGLLVVFATSDNLFNNMESNSMISLEFFMNLPTEERLSYIRGLSRLTGKDEMISKYIEYLIASSKLRESHILRPGPTNK